MRSYLLEILRGRNSYFNYVGGSMLLLIAYYGFICSDRYVSEASVIVQHENQTSSVLSSGLFSALGGSAPSVLEAELVKAFIESASMLDYLDENLQLRAHYSQPQIDWISRMSSDASSERFLKHYLNLISVDIDATSYVIIIEVQAFDPEYAQRLNRAVVARAEQFVNDISQQLAREQVAFIQRELETTSLRLRDETNRLVQYQIDNKLLSVDSETASVSAIIGALQGQLATERTNLKALLGYLNPSAAEVIAANHRIAALSQQLEQERAKQVGASNERGLNTKLLDFRELELNLEIATQMYQTALQTLESARLDAARKVKYLVSISAPTRPQSSGEPRRLYVLITAFVLINALYLIGKLLIATIKDHQE